MRLQLRKPLQSLHKAYARQPVLPEQMEVFRQALTKLFLRVDEKESDEYQQRIVADFLTEAYSTNPVRVDSAQWIDLVVESDPIGQKPTEQSGTIAVIETRKVFAGEMMTPLKNNVKPLHELILYYFDTAAAEPGRAISQLISTDVYNWFIFDERDFRRCFYNNPRLKKLYQIRQQQKKSDTYFFTETARILRELDADIPVTYLNLREAAESLTLPPNQGNQTLIPVFKLFSPEQLVKQSFTSGADTTSQRFYDELLHIIGLREVPKGKNGVLLERLPESERMAGALLENTIDQLQRQQTLAALDNPAEYGSNESEQLFSLGFELCTGWLTRLLFCKLIEAKRSKQNRSKPFFTSAYIPDFTALDDLFSAVLPVPEEQRSGAVRGRFEGVPYLHGPLFDQTNLEKKLLTIGRLDSARTLPLFGQTAINTLDSQPTLENFRTLDYLLTFLDAYDFSEDSPVVLSNARPRVSASGLGALFDRIMAHRQGSSVVPGRAVSVLVRDVLRRAVVAKFASLDELAETPKKIQDIDGLRHYLNQFHEPRALLQFNAVFNSLRLVDPVAGSGQFLVTALTELLALKAELGLLVDQEGQRIQQIDVSVFENELLITNESGDPVLYSAEEGQPSGFSGAERQRIQNTIFRETKTLVENCLFGVDSQLSAVCTGQFRLLVEMLKSAPANWSPDVNTNIKVGNALISRFALDFQADRLKSPTREKFLVDFSQYKADVQAYRQPLDKPEKEQTQNRIQAFHDLLSQIALADQKEVAEIRRLEARLAQSALPFDAGHQDDRLKRLTTQLTQKKAAFADKQRLFSRAFDWRFAFPELLDNAGNYTGFDVVIGDPSVSQPGDFTRVKAYFQQAFPNTYTSKAEPYVLFVELGMKLLRPDGQLVYWLPKKWMQAASAGKLRNWIQTRAIEQITDFSGLSVEDEATSWHTGLTVRNAESAGPYPTVRVGVLHSHDSEFSRTAKTKAVATSLPDNIRTIGQSALDT